jgi:hypothetical protein
MFGKQVFFEPNTWQLRCANCWGEFVCEADCRSFHPTVPDCTCGHAWEDHHHGCIMNPEYPGERHDCGICRGVASEECEAHQVNGDYSVPYDEACKCQGYKNSITGLSAYNAKGLDEIIY